MNGQQNPEGRHPRPDDQESEIPINESREDAAASAAPQAANDPSPNAEPPVADLSGEKNEAEPSSVGSDFDKVRMALEAEISNLTDRLLRAHAEMENLRKRTEREKSETAKYAITKFALDMVNISDNLQRAMAAAGDPDGHSEEMTALFDGVGLTSQELTKALDRHGVQRIEAQGQQFDPHCHQAMMEQPNPDVPSGTVLKVFQEGYAIGDRILRPAMVVVARGGPKPRSEGAPPGSGGTASEAHADPAASDTGEPGAGGGEQPASGEPPRDETGPAA